MKKLIKIMIAMFMSLSLVACSSSDSTSTSDLEYVKTKGTLIVGITDFEPMDYQVNGEWIGFDADMAKAFGDYIGVDVEFVEIDWDNKIFELNSKSIDCVWNGMTLTDEVKNSMSTSNAYCDNAQVVVCNKELADTITSTQSIKDLQIAVEAGSAAAEILDELNIEYTALGSQADALMSVAATTSDICVIDALMAGAMIGEGTSYPDLINTIALNSEQYGVGFRTDSDLTAELNTFFKTSYETGAMMDIAKTYGIQVSIIEQ